MTCWAQPLGDCGGGISREHIISASQFDSRSITILGLPWCREKPRQIGVRSLTAKTLCRVHNSALSPADSEAARFKKLLDIIHTPGTMPVREILDARLIERWLLKTTINLTMQQSDSGLIVTPALVGRAFGLEFPLAGQGFYVVAVEGEDMAQKDSGLRFETYLSNGSVVMGVFVFHRWRMLYAFEGAPQVLGSMRLRVINQGPSWLRFRWWPRLPLDDKSRL